MSRILILFFLLFPFLNSLFSEEKIPEAYLIADQIKKGLEEQGEEYISALISGIEARERGLVLSSDELQSYPLYIEKQREFLAQQNLSKSEKWIKDLQAYKNIYPIIPSKLLYSLLKKGTGATLTEEHGKVLINYTIKKLGELFPETIEKRKEVDLSKVIPGFAHGMLSMREGEMRIIYIHPEFAYQSNNFDPNIALEAIVELLEILPYEVAIPPLHENLSIKSKKITQNEVTALKLKSAYVLGWKLWDHLRWGEKIFTKEDLLFFLKKEPLKNRGSEDDEAINTIHWKIYHQRMTRS